MYQLDPAQQQILKARLNIARIRLTNSLMFPETCSITQQILPAEEVYALNSRTAARRAEYDRAHEEYNNFLDDRIQEVIANSGVLN
jgi:hypothetical protein